MDAFTAADTRDVARQLGRDSRGVAGVGWRCPCGRAGVVVTEPRLPDGSPFPTTYYLTCPQAVAGCSRLEAAGRMSEFTAELSADPDLADRYRAAHQAYLDDRAELSRRSGQAPVIEIADVSAGGMPDRVKCLHALVGHALAAGRGVNPIGDQALAEIGDFWSRPCLSGAEAE